MTAMTAGTVHNIGLAPITVGGTAIRSGGSLPVDDLEALGELPRGAYVVERTAPEAIAETEPSDATTAETAKPPRRPRAGAPEPEPPATDAEPGAGTDPAPQEPTA